MKYWNWDKFRIRLKNNKRYRVLMIIGTVLQIFAGLFFLLAFLQKDTLDSEEEKNKSNVQNEILGATQEIRFNTSSDNFFRENNYDKKKYRNIFKYGYTVYHHSPEFDRPFKKDYGNELLIDYSDVQIIEPSTKNGWHVLAVTNKFRHTPGETKWVDNNFKYRFIVNMDQVDKTQTLRGGIGEYGGPRFSLEDCLILLNYKKPYTYAIGPRDTNKPRGWNPNN